LALPQKSNTTNGSWWILQIQPTHNGRARIMNSTNGSWWIVQILPIQRVSRLDLKYPLTAVSGITLRS